jgi:hypothetical protein
MPGARCTRSPCAIGSKHTVVTTVTPEITRHSLRNGFNGFLRALPGDEFLFVTVTSGSRLVKTRSGRRISAGLTSATDARTTRLRRTQRPHQTLRQAMCRLPKFWQSVEAPFVRAPFDRSRAFRQPALRSHRAPNAAASTASHPASVTIAIRPSEGWDGMGYEVIWVR